MNGSLDCLPIEVMEMILEFLPMKEHLYCMSLNIAFRSIYHNERQIMLIDKKRIYERSFKLFNRDFYPNNDGWFFYTKDSCVGFSFEFMLIQGLVPCLWVTEYREITFRVTEHKKIEKFGVCYKKPNDIITLLSIIDANRDILWLSPVPLSQIVRGLFHSISLGQGNLLKN